MKTKDKQPKQCTNINALSIMSVKQLPILRKKAVDYKCNGK